MTQHVAQDSRRTRIEAAIAAIGFVAVFAFWHFSQRDTKGLEGRPAEAKSETLPTPPARAQRKAVTKKGRERASERERPPQDGQAHGDGDAPAIRRVASGNSAVTPVSDGQGSNASVAPTIESPQLGELRVADTDIRFARAIRAVTTDDLQRAPFPRDVWDWQHPDSLPKDTEFQKVFQWGHPMELESWTTGLAAESVLIRLRKDGSYGAIKQKDYDDWTEPAHRTGPNADISDVAFGLDHSDTITVIADGVRFAPVTQVQGNDRRGLNQFHFEVSGTIQPGTNLVPYIHPGRGSAVMRVGAQVSGVGLCRFFVKATTGELILVPVSDLKGRTRPAITRQ